MIPRRSFLLALIATIASSGLAHAQKAWATYKNDRFGATIEYPSDLFRPTKAPTNNDGRRFVTRDGAEFTCSGIRNLEESLADIEMTTVRTLGNDVSIARRELRPDSFVLWATQSGKTFFQHSILSHNTEILNTFIMSYPARRRNIYDPIVMRMSQSFKPGTGYDSGPNTITGGEPSTGEK